MRRARYPLSIAAVALLGAVAGAGEPERADDVPWTKQHGAAHSFELVDSLTMQAPGRNITVSTRAIVHVIALLDGFVVELRRGGGGEGIKEGAPPLGTTVVRGPDGAVISTAPVVEARLTCRWDPSTGAPREISGFPGDLKGELQATLERRSRSMLFQPEAEMSFTVPVMTTRGPEEIGAVQKNGAPQPGASTDRWLLPITFAVQEHKVSPRTSVSGEIGFTYDPARGSIEEPLVLKTEVRTSAKRATSLSRVTELRPVDVPLPPARSDEMPSLMAVNRLGGRSGDWTRALTLAVLATRRGAGLREVGAAAWLAQCVIDEQFGAVFKTAARKPVTPVSKLLNADLPTVTMQGISGSGLSRRRLWEVGVLAESRYSKIEIRNQDASAPPYDETHVWQAETSSAGPYLAFEAPNGNWSLWLAFVATNRFIWSEDDVTAYASLPAYFNMIYYEGHDIEFDALRVALRREWLAVGASRAGVEYKFVGCRGENEVEMYSHNFSFDTNLHQFEVYGCIPASRFRGVFGLRFSTQVGTYHAAEIYGSGETWLESENTDLWALHLGLTTPRRNAFAAAVDIIAAVDEGLSASASLGIRF